MKQRFWNWRVLSTASICILSVLYTIFSVFAMRETTETISRIYDHPYSVVSEASTMRTRLYVMDAYLSSVLAVDYEDPEVVTQMLEERRLQQRASLEKIKKRYLGNPKDLAELEEQMETLVRARQNAAERCKGHTPIAMTMEIVQREVSPHSAATDKVLERIIASTNDRMLEFQGKAVQLGRLWMLGALASCFLIVGLAVYMSWNEHRKNREIRYREKLFDLLSANIDDVFLIFNRESGKLEYVSENIQRVLGVQELEFRGEIAALYRALSKDVAEALQALLRDDALTGSAERLLQFEKDRQLRNLRIRAYPLWTQGRLQRYIVVLSDQTEEVAYQQVLRDALTSAQNANTAKRGFLSRMSHEIRTPMNAIIGMTAIALHHADNRDRVETCLGKIAYSSQHLLRLINDVLDMSKIEDGKLSITHEVFDFRKLIESITAIIHPQTVEREQEFAVSLQGAVEELLIGDALRVNQILLNLLSNAVKFTPRGGKIQFEVRRLRAAQGKVYLRFLVRDTGIGMSEAYLSRLYEPFEQADSSIAQKYGGTGLGMSITKNLVSMLGGIIAVESAEGKGTQFTVKLPFDLPELEPGAARPALESLRVLVADDDIDSCEHASLLLEQLGVRARWVLTGGEAVDAVVVAHEKSEDYDVCFIDWKMPDMDGVETTRRIRRHVGPDTLIIIISAYDWSQIETTAREAGANAFISKPFFASSLYDTLVSVTRRSECQSAKADKSYDFTGKKILLAEDNQLNREIAMELLEMTGAAVDSVENGREAVERFIASENAAYDLILMDIQMPLLDGYEATREIRASAHPRAADVPILAMTANAFSDDVSAALAAGMNAHIAKPIDVRLLYDTIAPYLFRQTEEREREAK